VVCSSVSQCPYGTGEWYMVKQLEFCLLGQTLIAFTDRDRGGVGKELECVCSIVR